MMENGIIPDFHGSRRFSVKDRFKEIILLATEYMPVAVSVIDSKGTLLYYNRRSAELLDRNPEYLGTDIHSHHKNRESNRKVDMMLDAFKAGRTDPFHYDANPYGEPIRVTLTPVFENGEFIGCVQTVSPKENPISK